MFNFKQYRNKRRDKIREEIKSIVREAMDEWTADCEYLTPNKGEGRYFCSKPDCEGVKFNND
jgi:hypothetical protein